MKVREMPLPEGTLLAGLVGPQDFVDCYAGETPLDVETIVARATEFPVWVKGLLLLLYPVESSRNPFFLLIGPPVIFPPFHVPHSGLFYSLVLALFPVVQLSVLRFGCLSLVEHQYIF